MAKIYIYGFLQLMTLVLISGCATNSMVQPGDITLSGPQDQDGFILQPGGLSSPIATFYDSGTGLQVTKPWATLSNEQIQKILSDTHATISVGKFDVSGNLTYLAASATASLGTYKVVMDYCEFKTEDVVDQNTNHIGLGRVGVGLRLTATVTTTKANVNLGSIFALGVAASEGSLNGTMTVDSIGIRIAGSGGPILSNATIDESSIQKTLESIAVIQSKVADPTTTLDPQILSIKPATPAIKPADITTSLQNKT